MAAVADSALLYSMSENRLRYTLYFQSRAEARRWVDEAEATERLPLDAQAQALEALLGLPEGSGASFEFASCVGLLAELAVLGPWSLLPGDGWPAGLAERGGKLFGCEWDDGAGDGQLQGLWFNGPGREVSKKQFEAAARKMDPMEEVRQLLHAKDYEGLLDLVHKHGLDPNTVVGHWPLMVYLFTLKEARNNNPLPTDAILALLQAGARPDPVALVTRMPEYFTMPVFPLLRAAHCFDSRLMRGLLDAGADVNGVDDQGRTALHALVSSSKRLKEPPERCLQALQLLLDAGADVNAHSPVHGTPLTQGGHQRVRDLLAAHGARVAWPESQLQAEMKSRLVHAVGGHDHAWLDALLAQEPPDEALHLQLLQQAIEIGNHHALDRLWREGVDHALALTHDGVFPRLLVYSLTDQPEMDQAMLSDLAARSAGKPVPGQSDPQWAEAAATTLRLWVGRKEPQPPLALLPQMLDLGLPVNAPPGSFCALAAAIAAHWTDAVALLLERGADPNHSMPGGGNALHEALYWKATDCIPLLLQAGVDRERCDQFGKSPMQHAVSKRNRAAQKYLAA